MAVCVIMYVIQTSCVLQITSFQFSLEDDVNENIFLKLILEVWEGYISSIA